MKHHFPDFLILVTMVSSGLFLSAVLSSLYLLYQGIFGRKIGVLFVVIPCAFVAWVLAIEANRLWGDRSQFNEIQAFCTDAIVGLQKEKLLEGFEKECSSFDAFVHNIGEHDLRLSSKRSAVIRSYCIVQFDEKDLATKATFKSYLR